MAEDKITPEEKLLRLIENPAQAKDAKSLPAGQAGPAVGKAGKPKKFKFKFKFNILNSIKQFPKIKDKLKPLIFNFKFINQSLIVLSVLITIYLIFDFIKGRPNLNKIYAYIGTEPAASRIRDALEVKAVDISDYLSQLGKRDIFHFIPLKKEEKPPETKDVLSGLATDLKLVGIIWSAKPQAMIEDKKENKTLLLNQGDMIGKIKIKQILRDKVILGYEDQETELL